MDSHPSYSILSPFTTKYPRLSGCLFQVYNDLLYAQRWENLVLQELPDCGRIVLKGQKPETNVSYIVIPCNLSESFSLDWLSSVFNELGDVPEVHLAIANEDSSSVYYRLSKGIVKPPS